MAEFVVIQHAISWHARDPETKVLQHWSAHRGETVDLPDDTVARFRQLTAKDGLPRIGTQDEHDAWVRSSAAPSVTDVAYTDIQLKAMTAEQLTALLTQHNHLAYQILGLEEVREQPRQSLIDHANGIIDTLEGRQSSPPPAAKGPAAQATARAAQAEAEAKAAAAKSK